MNGQGLPRLFVDHCVPESVSKLLEARGYQVMRLRESIAPDSSDDLVAAIAEANGAILVTMDSDFKGLASRSGIGRRRLKTLSLIRFEKCRESQAAKRLGDALSLIEHEWRVGGSSNDRRMFIVIMDSVIRTHR